MECKDTYIPNKEKDECQGTIVKDKCVQTTFDFPFLNIYKGDSLDDTLQKLINYIMTNEQV